MPVINTFFIFVIIVENRKPYCKKNNRCYGFVVMVFLLFIFLLLAGCTNPPYKGQDVMGANEFVLDSYQIREGKFSILEMEGQQLESLHADMLCEYADVVENGDVLEVVVYHPNRKDIGEAVQSVGSLVGYQVVDGRVILPELGKVVIAGLSLEEARQVIQLAYREELSKVEVFVAYKDRLERKVELAGLVHLAAIPVDGKIRLFEVLAKAQIPTSANLFKSYVVRGIRPIPVEMNKLMKEGDMSQNIVMRGGDKIYIADESAANLMVMGEVGKPGVVNLPSGTMSLREALARAGGIPFTGDKGYIQVIRGNIIRPKIYTLNWEHVVRLPLDSMLLMPGDIVYVAATPITEWNRFISQLFPSFTAIDLFCKGMTGIVAIP
jgi:polysaccharide biosynthesis/export protein